MIDSFDLDALTLTGGRVLFLTAGMAAAPGHDIPHPIGDPDEDEGLPDQDEEDEDDDDDDDDDEEEPLQVRAPLLRRPILHRSTFSVFLL